MRRSRAVPVLLIGIAMAAISVDAGAYTEHTFPGILCVQDNIGMFSFGSPRQSSSVGLQNAATGSQMYANCPMTRKDGTSTSWIAAEVVVRNPSTSANLTCTLFLWDGYGNDVQSVTQMAPPNGYWVLGFTNPNPSQNDYKDYYTIDCSLPAATGSYWYNRSEVLTYWLRQP